MSVPENRYDAFYPDRHPDFEMLEAAQLTKTNSGPKWTELTDKATGRKFIRGHGGGTIIFDPDGAVRVWWDRNAAIASSHSTGNRKAKAIQPADKGQAPQRDELFKLVGACRRYFSNDESRCPEGPRDPAAKTFARVFSDLSWRMLRAVGNGDFEELRLVADTLKLYEDIHSGRLETPTGKFDVLARAIAGAARSKNGIPERHEIEKLWRDSVSDNEKDKEGIKHDLNRMGFGWIPAPAGHPKKVK